MAYAYDLPNLKNGALSKGNSLRDQDEMENIIISFELALSESNAEQLLEATDLIIATFLNYSIENDTMGIQRLNSKLTRLLSRNVKSSDFGDEYLGQISAIKKLTDSLYRNPSPELIGKVMGAKHYKLIFRTLIDRSMLTPTELAQRLNVCTQRASQIFSALTELQLVRRRKIGKIAYYHLTLEGRRVAHSILQPATSMENTVSSMKKIIEEIKRQPCSIIYLAITLDMPESLVEHIISPLSETNIVKKQGDNYVLNSASTMMLIEESPQIGKPFSTLPNFEPKCLIDKSVISNKPMLPEEMPKLLSYIPFNTKFNGIMVSNSGEREDNINVHFIDKLCGDPSVTWSFTLPKSKRFLIVQSSDFKDTHPDYTDPKPIWDFARQAAHQRRVVISETTEENQKH